MSGVAAIGGESRASPKAAVYAVRPLRTIPTCALGTCVRFMTSSTAARTFADRAAGSESTPVVTRCAAAGVTMPDEKRSTNVVDRATRGKEPDIETLHRGDTANV